MKDDFSDFDFVADEPNAGRWTVEQNDSYALFSPMGMQAAPVHWDSCGRCWARWDHGAGIHLMGAVYASDVQALAKVLSDAKKPAGVVPVEPEF